MGLMIASVLKKSANQVLNKDSNIEKEFRKKKAGEAFLKARNMSTSVRQNQARPHSRGLTPDQTIPPHTVQFWSEYHMDMTLYNNARQLPCKLWYEK